MTAFPSAGELGRIETAGGYVYQIKPEDVLWLARSVAREGGNQAATIWTYLQRQAASRRSGSLASLILAHSQPINPIWRRDGEKCRPGGAYHDRDECAESRLLARDRAASVPWDSIPEATRSLVVRAAQANLPNPVPRATDFANEPVSRGFLSRNPDAGIVLRAGNWYLYEGRSASWPPGFVRIGYQGHASLEIPAANRDAPSWVGPALGATALVASWATFWWLFGKK